MGYDERTARIQQIHHINNTDDPRQHFIICCVCSLWVPENGLFFNVFCTVCCGIFRQNKLVLYCIVKHSAPLFLKYVYPVYQYYYPVCICEMFIKQGWKVIVSLLPWSHWQNTPLEATMRRQQSEEYREKIIMWYYLPQAVYPVHYPAYMWGMFITQYWHRVHHTHETHAMQGTYKTRWKQLSRVLFH